MAWFVSPIDLIPEFIPVAGPLDDALVAALVLRHVLRCTDRAVLRDHWHGDPSTLDAIIRMGRRKPQPPSGKACSIPVSATIAPWHWAHREPAPYGEPAADLARRSA